MWTTIVPKLVPLMRASLMRTMSFTPALSSFAGMGRWPHSGIPGAPLGPAFFSTITEFSSTGKFGSSRRASKSRLFWKTTARPRCFIRCGETADCLMTAPSGARFPFRMTTPPWGNRGLVERPDDLTIKARRALQVFTHGLAAGGQRIQMQQRADFLQHGGHAAGVTEFFHQVFSGGLHVGDEGRGAGDFIERGEGQVQSPTARQWPPGARWHSSTRPAP